METTLSPRIWGFCPFLYNRMHGLKLPDDGRIFLRRKPIPFDILIMQLYNSCSDCVLDHSCSTLHTSRDCQDILISVWREMKVSIPNCTKTDYQTARKLP